ncbi:NADPH-dependent FMN reductase [Maricaulis sp. MIT060901]|uniref:NADPH-dependent FMN reductase n=1 Tax=Maricaulis sp. MIT060901 TaxID=3096993 RepID=UPI00399BB6CD
MSAPKILVLAGSARKDSVNKKLATNAADIARDRGAKVTHIDLADYEAPLYHGDDEAENGLPDSMKAMRKLLAEHDAMIVATPEYNGNIPPLLVNTFDWMSRPDGEDRSNPFAGKLAILMAASPGGLGGVRVIPRLRAFLTDLGMMPLPGHASVPGAFQAFDEDGRLTNDRSRGQIESLVDNLTKFLGGA